MTQKKMYDGVIVGGGVMGASLACTLLALSPDMKIAVVERDPVYKLASTTLSMANVRVQFSLKENVLISMYAISTLREFEQEMALGDCRPNIAFRQEGNLFLCAPENREKAEADLAMQKSLGCRVEWWDPDRIRDRYPLYDPSGLAGGVFGHEDGHFDAYGVLMGYKSKAASLGARFIHDDAVEIRTDGGRVTGVRLKCGEELTCGFAVNCAGAWAAMLAETAGVKLPVVPVRRQVFAAKPAVVPETPLPLTILPSGLYFRTETGGTILIGKSMPDDPQAFDFNWDENRFMEELWPELAGFVPAFDTLKLMRGWAGLYAVNTMDSNAILGEWPELPGFWLMNGFSGHGLQQAPAVSRYVAEAILGITPSLDLSIFKPDRILENRPLSESGLV